MNISKTIMIIGGLGLGALVVNVLGLSVVRTGHCAGKEKSLPPGIISKEPAKTFVEHVGKINATPAFFEPWPSNPIQGQL